MGFILLLDISTWSYGKTWSYSCNVSSSGCQGIWVFCMGNFVFHFPFHQNSSSFGLMWQIVCASAPQMLDSYIYVHLLISCAPFHLLVKLDNLLLNYKPIGVWIIISFTFKFCSARPFRCQFHLVPAVISASIILNGFIIVFSFIDLNRTPYNILVPHSQF